MASFTDVPDLAKVMNYLFGEKWGKRISRVIVIFILVAVAGGAVAGAMGGINAITSWASSNPVTSNILLSLLLMLILAIGMLGVGGGLGLLIGAILQVTLAVPMRQNVDSVLEQTELLLLNANQTGVEDADKLLASVRLLKTQWNTSRTTRIANWIFKKGTGKQQK